jgi:hypothetical protein
VAGHPKKFSPIASSAASAMTASSTPTPAQGNGARWGVARWVITSRLSRPCGMVPPRPPTDGKRTGGRSRGEGYSSCSDCHSARTSCEIRPVLPTGRPLLVAHARISAVEAGWRNTGVKSGLAISAVVSPLVLRVAFGDVVTLGCAGFVTVALAHGTVTTFTAGTEDVVSPPAVACSKIAG